MLCASPDFHHTINQNPSFQGAYCLSSCFLITMTNSELTELLALHTNSGYIFWNWFYIFSTHFKYWMLSFSSCPMHGCNLITTECYNIKLLMWSSWPRDSMSTLNEPPISFCTRSIELGYSIKSANMAVAQIPDVWFLSFTKDCI